MHLINEMIRIWWDIAGLIALVGVLVIVYGGLEGVMGIWDRYFSK
jgi:uncharacterized membrane protein